ncbi:MAG TPA: metallophosphoesterase [Nitrososphaeraceae archaeon]|nr:metallophosphoesterase [Nitrososphaeraceae archaeon]
MLLLTTSFIVISIIFFNNNSFATASNTSNSNEFNIITAADFGCSLRAQENIKNIEKFNPELVLVPGDLSYKKTADCWFDMTKGLDSKIKIALGNHEAYEEEGPIGEILKKSIMDHYGLDKSYYSFDYRNVHVLVLDTQLELSVDTLQAAAIINDTSIKNKEEDKDKPNHKKENPLLERYPTIDIKDFIEKNSINIKDPSLEKLEQKNAQVPDLEFDKGQYQFVLDDLKKTNQNKNIEWIFVIFHKPMYSSISKQLEEYIMRDKYQQIFDKYNVDLVIQGHNHIYSRTLPLSFNSQQISEPILDQNIDNSNNNGTFTQPDGIVYLVVGTGGDELYEITEKPYYVQNQYDKGFGFVDLKIDGKKLDGTFYVINLVCQMKISEKKKKEVLDLESCMPPAPGTDELKILDHFTINK